MDWRLNQAVPVTGKAMLVAISGWSLLGKDELGSCGVFSA